MAKPIPAAAPDPPAPTDPPVPPSRRRGPRQRSPPPPATPSPALLSLLATIVASSPPVDASPTPLSFLCPSLPQSVQRRETSPSHPIPGHSQTRRAPKSPRNRILPYKFYLGDDGIWHEAQSYTLYGSTVCSKNCREPTNAVASGNSSVTSPTPSSSTMDSIDLQDTLPAGWKSKHSRSESRTTLILALSLVLAFFICFFIIGCLFWRKNLRRKHRDGDVETRSRRRSSTITLSSQPVLDTEKDAKVKQKIWARATARWRANARYVARHRRGKRQTSIRSQPLDSTTTLNPLMMVTDSPRDEELASSSASRTVSRNISRRSSFTSLREAHSLAPTQQDQEQQAGLALVPTLNSVSDAPASPPAYRQRTFATSATMSPGSLSAPERDYTSSALRIPSPHPSHLSLGPSFVESKSSSQHQEPDILPPPAHVAHVATDDKALLARLADLAERPPGEPLAHAESSHQLSAPVWQDEQLEDFARELGPLDLNTSGSTSQSPFPPPPAKGKMAESLFYNYPYTFEDFSESIEPELEPCAPPFEAHGAPVVGDLIMLPSAPPLAEEEFPQGSHLDAATDPDVEEAHVRRDCDRYSVDHPTAPPGRPLSEGTLPDYQP